MGDVSQEQNSLYMQTVSCEETSGNISENTCESGRGCVRPLNELLHVFIDLFYRYFDHITDYHGFFLFCFV